MNAKKSISLFLFISIFVAFFAYNVYQAEAVTIKLLTPLNYSYNKTRVMNFTFYANWTSNQTTEDSLAASNCSLWVTNTTRNYTQVTTNFTRVAINDTSNSRIVNASTTGNISYINYTFDRDGNYTWSISCNETQTGPVFNQTNFTVTIDTIGPKIVGDSPSGTLASANYANSTSFNLTAQFNVLDNNTHTVWYIISDLPDVIPTDSVNQTNANTTNALTQSNYTANPSEYGLGRVYRTNLSASFNSSFLRPGPHGIWYCANDSAGNVNCSSRYDFVVLGVDVTQMENIFTEMQNPEVPEAGKLGGLNITYGNGTEVPANTFINPLGGGNFTFIFNFSAAQRVFIVGGRIDEKQMANASRTNMTSTVTDSVKIAGGTGFVNNLMWVDMAKFIPSEVNYEYGIMEIVGTGFSRKMFCNGSTTTSPNCFYINQCNSTTIGLFNHTKIIPPNSACWLEGGVGYGMGGNSSSEFALRSTYTYIFVDHFSGGNTLNDTNAPNVTFSNPTSLLNQTSATLSTINVTFSDLNSSGINLTKNLTIKINLSNAGDPSPTLGVFVYQTVNSNITCSGNEAANNNDNASIVVCHVNSANLTVTSLPNGTINMTIEVKDTSNNTNVNLTWITFTVDQIPPVLVYFNITNTSLFNRYAGISDASAQQLGTGAGFSRAQAHPIDGTIFATSNWTDNLTQPLRGLLQFYNTSSGSGAWQTINESPIGYSAFINISNNINLSFVIPYGHNEFEGNNISFRVAANDTLGNVNTSMSVRNITIRINDTTPATIAITSPVNGSNTSSVSGFTVTWSITEGSSLNVVNITIDGAGSEPGDNYEDPLTCGRSKRFLPYAANSSNNVRNGSMTMSSLVACNLANGTHHVVVRTTESGWSNNGSIANITFMVDTEMPSVSVTTSLYNQSGSLGVINGSNVSLSRGGRGLLFNASDRFSGFSGAPAATFSIPACGVSGTFLPNQTFFPFNTSGGSCSGKNLTASVLITVNDTAGNSNSTTFLFGVDDLAPGVVIHTPTANQEFSDNITLNWSVREEFLGVQFVGYYIDGKGVGGSNTPFELNFSASGLGNGTGNGNHTHNTRFVNISEYSNITLGTHTIKLFANDTVGNEFNTSAVTFITKGRLNFAAINKSLISYVDNASINLTIRVKVGDTYQEISTFEYANSTLELAFVANSSERTVNITISDLNGSKVNWDNINFSLIASANGTAPPISTVSYNPILGNYSVNAPLVYIFSNISTNFITDNDSYFVYVVVPYNISGAIATAQQIWWFPNSKDVSSNASGRVNVSQCTAAFTRTDTTPCWNYTSGGGSIISIPHFSDVLVVNDTTAPTVNVTTPQSANQTVSAFIPNITVSSDAVSCKYNMTNSSQVVNVTMTLNTQITPHICIGQTEKLKNFQIDPRGYNITFYVADASNNINTYIWGFNVTDSTAPNNGVISSSAGSTTATVTITSANESVNATVRYGTANTSFSNTVYETDFNQTQAVSLTSLTASSTYYFNVTVCDFNGNCYANTTIFSFSTSASTTTTTTVAAAAGSGASGGGAVAADNIQASSAKSWNVISPSAPAVMPITKSGVAISEISIAVKSELQNVELKVDSLKSNPLTSPAASKVYQYLQITRTNIANTDIEKATIKFKVSKSWLSSNNVAEDNIVLYRYDGKWVQLSTKKVSSDSSDALYESTTSGFSTFAIGVKTEGAPVETPPGEVTTTTVPAVTTTTQPAAKPVAPPVEKPKSRTGLIVIIAFVVALAALLGYITYKKKGRKI